MNTYLTKDFLRDILVGRCNRSFFYAQILRFGSANNYNGGEIVVRVKITLACTECKQRNYDTTKEKKNHPDRMETKKYCRFCKAHTLHKETK